ncbi:GtrA family protein [Streptococcus massiliensis]|uniref:GtrA family protein n=1 Tax=Streptococcus massiliensis TaxID=313439 RepID=A0A380KW44_9STRE|nr:GtrA family protein [Streptococcus massiliensis]SUN76153.1 GtrA family protein [Streptococcus massiliensis]
MKRYIKKFFDNEVLSYLFFGVATTVVSVLTRMLAYELSGNEIFSTILGNVAGILFAFVTNDTIVFKQKRQGWLPRLLKFITARLTTLFLDVALTFLFVTTFPGLIGQFVNNDIKAVNTIETLIAQVLIIVLNYVFSKIFVFKNRKKELK